VADGIRLDQAVVGIGGLGLMGGSLAMALSGRCRRMVGWEPDPQALALAREVGLLDEAQTDLAALTSSCDLIVLAAPVRSILACLEQLPNQHPGPAVVMDLGSTKGAIVRAMQQLPGRFDPIGGHPMCGKETSGLASAVPNLFQGAPFALTALDRTTPRAKSLAEQLVAAIGGVSLWIDAATHDRWVASTSHLPFLVAAALSLCTPEEVQPLVGPGFVSTSRLAASQSEMMGDILATNRSLVLSAVERFRKELAELERLLTHADDEQLLPRLRLAADRRRLLLQRSEESRAG
jgi:prephenate dehydrogenase